MLCTEEIEEEAEKLYKMLNESVDEEYRINCHDYYQFRNSDPNDPGTYIYSDKDGYHKDFVGDRGGLEIARIIENLDDIYYSICEHLSFTIARKYEVKNRVKGQDTRRLMFSKQLEILQKVNLKYYQRCKEEIEKILKENPYDDELAKKFDV